MENRLLSQKILNPKFVHTAGGLLIKDVKLLASGEWTDSNVQTPLFYTPEALEKYAENWEDHSTWPYHAGGSVRYDYERIGVVLNPHFDDEAIVGDVFLHGATELSRNTMTGVINGDLNYVSVEHSGEEQWNEETQRNESKTLTFFGLAVVPQGACRKCKIRNNSSPGGNMSENDPTDPVDLETQVKELSEAIGDRDTKIKELEELVKDESKMKELADGFDAKIKELSEKIDAKDATIEAMDKRIKELEAQPDPRTLSGGGEDPL
ncbi:hypothetical protein [Methanococcoides sp. FTZ1]|uniref:hypothetical protein n=1 Tax=Methanococcoides sp. FTZ1 TaxID=3439061 RepID=UPI003F86F4CB